MQILWPTDNQSNVLDTLNKHHPGYSLLTNGQMIKHPWYLDGGGSDYRYYFVDAINKHGKTHYKNALEWCCGHSIIGFEILTKNLCENLSLSDYYDLAINVSLDNAKLLGYEDKVKGFITPAISNIPKTEKYDLVVGNPPNLLSPDQPIDNGIKNGLCNEHVNMELRIMVDNDFEAHKEFFQNIKSYLLDDADIFLTMHLTQLTMVERDFSNPCGFFVKNIFDMFPRDPNLKIVHFKYN